MDSHKKHSILFVDDEESILNSIKRGLHGQPYQMYFATSGPAALEIIEENDISVVISDMRMPGMDGLELLKIVNEKYPDTVRIVLTGYSHISLLMLAINSGQVYRYLTKPWKMEEEFLVAIQDAVRYHEILTEKRSLVAKLSKQKEELSALKGAIEESDHNKSRILEHLTDALIPFIDEALILITKLKDIPDYHLRETTNSLEEKGLKARRLLKGVHDLLNKEKQ